MSTDLTDLTARATISTESSIPQPDRDPLDPAILQNRRFHVRGSTAMHRNVSIPNVKATGLQIHWWLHVFANLIARGYCFSHAAVGMAFKTEYPIWRLESIISKPNRFLNRFLSLLIWLSTTLSSVLWSNIP